MFERVEVVTNYVEVLRVLVLRLAIVFEVGDDNRFCFGRGQILGIGFAEEFQFITLLRDTYMTLLQTFSDFPEVGQT